MDFILARLSTCTPRGADALAAGLEGLLYADARAGDLGPGLVAEGDEPVERRAVGEEVVYDEHAVAAAEVLLADEYGVLDVVGESVDTRLVQNSPARGSDVRFFLGKQNRAAECQRPQSRPARCPTPQ